jgi:hypothetical protein
MKKRWLLFQDLVDLVNRGGIDEIAYEFLFVLVSEEIRAKRLPKRAKHLVEMSKKTKNLNGSPF